MLLGAVLATELWPSLKLWQSLRVAGSQPAVSESRAEAESTAQPVSEQEFAPGNSRKNRAGTPSLLRQAHARLLSHRTIQAEIVEVATLTDPPLRLTGRYLSAGIKLRLEYDVQLAGNVEGHLTEVCDGDRLWSWMQLPGSSRVTRRDIRQILAAAGNTPQLTHSGLTVDLALGGLPALISALDQSMEFDEGKQESFAGQEVQVLTGRWNAATALMLGGDATQPRFPAYIPDAARLTLATGSCLPLRLQYFKKRDGKLRPLLELRFQNLITDQPIDDRQFSFTPPEGVEPEDITRQYLADLQAGGSSPGTEKTASE